VEFLGLIVGRGVARMDPVKTAAINDWPTPYTKKELQRFLGFCNFYRRFIQDYSAIAKPLTTLTGNIDWSWTPNEHFTFEHLIHAITSDPILHLPKRHGKFRVEADASDYAIGAVLSQLHDDVWHPIAYLSKTLTAPQRNYEVYDKELLAIMESLDAWRHYLIGADEEFEIWTDHQNLQYFRNPQRLNRRQARWVSQLADYHFTLHHKAGSANVKADFLSRPPGLNKGVDDNQNIILLPESHFRSLFLNLQGAELLLGAFPEAVLTRLSHIPSHYYDKVAKIGLQSNDKDWNDHGNGQITYCNRIYIPPHSNL